MKRVRVANSARRRARAFTLIEAIAAIVLLSVAVPSMTWGVRDAVIRRTDPIKLTKARWLLAERMEQIIADRHSTSRGYDYCVTAAYPAEGSVSGFTGFSRSVSINAINTTVGTTGWKMVTVSVTYVDGVGVARTITLSTILTSYTP